MADPTVAPGGPGPGAEAAAAPGHETDPRRWIILGTVLAATFMVLIDISIVNVAIPSIQRTLSATFAQIQLVIALYSLAYAVVLITGGRLGDIYGRKRLFMLGVSGFTIASLLCGFAQSPEMLIGSRILQGLMAALMYPQVLSVVQVTFPPRERGSAFAVLGATVGVATIAGPLLGGVLIQGNLFGLEWRPIFLVNVPIGIGAVLAASFLLHESRAEHANQLDPVGVVIVTLGLGLLVYPLIEGRDAGWPLWAYVSLAASLPVLALFFWYEQGKTARNDSPLMDMHLFRIPSFVSGTFVGVFLFSGIPSFFLTFSLFLQIGLGFTALETGVSSVPFSIGSMLASASSARLAPRLGRRILSMGSITLTIGALLVILTIRISGPDLKGYYLAPALFVCGIGLGWFIAPLLNFILAAVPLRSAGSASGLFTTVQQVGTALGIALIGVILFGLLARNADDASAQVKPDINRQLAAAGVPQSAIARIDQAFAVCFHDRSTAKDPTAVPESCRQAQRIQLFPSSGLSPLPPQQSALGQTISAILRDAGLRSLKINFWESVQVAFLFDLAVWALTFFLIPFLPARPAHLGPPAAEA
jgi:EmrB/QacA subfamily drug resistance transporter